MRTVAGKWKQAKRPARGTGWASWKPALLLKEQSELSVLTRKDAHPTVSETQLAEMYRMVLPFFFFG